MISVDSPSILKITTSLREKPHLQVFLYVRGKHVTKFRLTNSGSSSEINSNLLCRDRIFYQRRIGTISSSPTSKLNEIQKNIDGWEVMKICTENPVFG